MLYYVVLFVYSNRNYFSFWTNLSLSCFYMVGTEGYVQFGMFEQIIYSMYKWTVECGGVQCGGILCGGAQCDGLQCGVLQYGGV